MTHFLMFLSMACSITAFFCFLLHACISSMTNWRSSMSNESLLTSYSNYIAYNKHKLQVTS